MAAAIARGTWLRVATALAVAGLMLYAALIATAVWLTSPMVGFDSGDPNAGDQLGRVAFVAAIVLFLGTGPVAYLISRRRALLGLPLLVAATYAVAVGVAAAL